MAWAAPWFLSGLALIGLPWWLHRREEQAARRESFPSKLLLEESGKKLLVSKRIQYWLLLALRIAAIVLLCFAFGEPYLTRNSQAEAGQPRATLLVDVSLSMRGVDFVAAGRELIDSASAGTRWTLLESGTFGDIVTNVTRDELLDALSGLQPGYLRRDFGEMMGLLATRPEPTGMTYVLTDQQASAIPEDRSRLRPYATGPLAIADAPPARQNFWLERIATAGKRATVYASAGSDGQPVSWWLDDSRIGQTEITNRIATIDLPTLGGERYRLEARLEISDALPADNRFFAVIDNAPAAMIPVISSRPSDAPVYLSAALAATGTSAQASYVAASQLDWRTLGRFGWVVLDDPGALNDTQQAELDAYVRRGGHLLVLAGEQTAALGALPFFDWPIEPLRATSTSLTAQVLDAGHPVTEDIGSWRSVQIFRRVALELPAGATPLIGLDDGSPLLVATDYGRGQIVVLTTRLDNNWSDLSTRGAFVTLVGSVSRFFGDDNSLKSARTVGEKLTVIDGGEVVTPEGRRISYQVENDSSFSLDTPGFYTVYSQSEVRLIAANTDRRESQLAPMTEATLRYWETPDAEEAKLTQTTALKETPARQSFAKSILWILLLLAALESFKANLTRSSRIKGA